MVVAVSAPNETRWGFTQFPAFSSLPDGRILLTYTDAQDASETHGEPSPARVSADGGTTWSDFHDQLVPTRPHFSITPCYHGEYLAVPATRYLNFRTDCITLPPPVSEGDAYGIFYSYRVRDLPAANQAWFSQLDAYRWTPSTRAWHRDTTRYAESGLLTWRRHDSDVLPRTFLERSALQHRGELFYADYRVRYSTPDGHYPGKGGTNLMVSSDNGRSFSPRAIVALDRANYDLYGEPALEQTTDGGLVAVMRKTDQNQKPMAIAYSRDAGHTWTAPEDFCTFGVFPYLLRLSSGPLLVSYGRPGVWLRINPDGNGRNWADPVCILPGDPATLHHHSCGYTSMHALGHRSFLLAYSDFDHRDADGTPRKAIISRRIDLVD
ncbi:MAG: hypothetical protein IT582_10625 [Opitutaceae bacterium]|nr:hypothetical protein [Opitutaceae bacterium]